MFSIRFTGRRRGVALGSIWLGTYSETFESVLDFWSESEYQLHWRQVIRSLCEGGRTRSALITSLPDIRTANFLVWWPVYREGVNVFIRNHILFLQDEGAGFSLASMEYYIPERLVYSNDGNKISEWAVSVSDCEKFLKEVSV